MAESKGKPRPGLQMGGSLGALPTENLLQMIGNLRLSARLLLENQSNKDFCILTFREGELVPQIESSHYASLKDALKENPEVNQNQLAELVSAPADIPLWNRLQIAGVIDRDSLKKFLIEGVRATLEKFKNLSGVHFELSPLSMDRVGTLAGFPVTEICALARKPGSVPMPEPRKTEQKPKPVGSKKQDIKKDVEDQLDAILADKLDTGKKPEAQKQKSEPLKEKLKPKQKTETRVEKKIESKAPVGKKSLDKTPSEKVEKIQTEVKSEVKPPPPLKPSTLSAASRQQLNDFLRHLRDLVPKTLACFILDCSKEGVIASSSTLMLDDRPDFNEISKLVCEHRPPKGVDSLKTREMYLITEDYLTGVNFLSESCCLLVICRQDAPLGVMLTTLRRARGKVVGFLEQKSK